MDMEHPAIKFDGEAKERFLRVFAQTGRLTDSAAAAGVSRWTINEHKKADLVFAKKCEEAYDEFRDTIEEEIYRRAVLGVEQDVYFQGKPVGTKLVLSDALLQALAKRHIREYRDKLDVSTEDGSGVLVIPIIDMMDKKLPGPTAKAWRESFNSEGVPEIDYEDEAQDAEFTEKERKPDTSD